MHCAGICLSFWIYWFYLLTDFQVITICLLLSYTHTLLMLTICISLAIQVWSWNVWFPWQLKITLFHSLPQKKKITQTIFHFCPVEQSGGGAAEVPTPWWHQGVQIPRGSSAAGLQRIGGGKHCAAETCVCAQTEPGNLYLFMFLLKASI